MNKIPLMKPQLCGGELEAIERVLSSGHLTEGAVTREFEKDIASYVGVSEAIACTSCTSALETCLRVLEIGKGDEVIIPDYTFPATADVVYLVGAEPILVDVDIKSYNMEPSILESSITERTKCIIPVSLFGNPIDERIYDIGAENDIAVVEDAACSIGAELAGKRVGSLADMSCFSFHPRKLITTGEGGMIVTDDEALAEKVRRYKRFGGVPAEDGFSTCFNGPGTNNKLSDILSAIGRTQMERIEDFIGDRIEKAGIYSRLLKDRGWCETPKAASGNRHTYQSYTINLKMHGQRDKAIQSLRSQGIEAQIGTYALHKQPFFSDARVAGALDNSTNLSENSITLPIYGSLSFEDQQMIVDRLTKMIEDED